MRKLSSIYGAPTVPAVYAVYGGRGRGLYVAYVGAGGSLKTRLIQHFVRRDSSVVTGRSAVAMHPDFVTEVRWWEHPDFSAPLALGAAELVAFDVLSPALRSRGAVRKQVLKLYGDPRFKEIMSALFNGEAAGRIAVPSSTEVFERLGELERRVTSLERAADRKSKFVG
jgi:hypothetical protein